MSLENWVKNTPAHPLADAEDDRAWIRPNRQRVVRLGLIRRRHGWTRSLWGDEGCVKRAHHTARERTPVLRQGECDVPRLGADAHGRKRRYEKPGRGSRYCRLARHALPDDGWLFPRPKANRLVSRTSEAIARSAGTDRLDPIKLNAMTLLNHWGRAVPLSQVVHMEIRPIVFV